MPLASKEFRQLERRSGPKTGKDSQRLQALTADAKDRVSMRESYAALLELCALVEKQPDFYYYTYGSTDLTDQDASEISRPHVSIPLFALLYGKEAAHQANLFGTAQDQLFSCKDKNPPWTLETSECAILGRNILTWSYKLVDAMGAVIEAPITGKSAIGGLKGTTLTELNRLATEVGNKKTLFFTETLRRYVPRWMTHLINIQELIHQVDAPEEVVAQWINYTTEAAHYLVNPMQTQAGTPLFMVLQGAEKIDNPDIKYRICSRAITEILRTERLRSADEVPFFHYILASCLQKKPHHAPKNAFFDFGVTLNNFIRETLANLRQEIQTNSLGSALAFLQELQNSFGNNFVPLFAAALCRIDLDNPEFNGTELLHGLEQHAVGWGEQLLQAVVNTTAERQVLYDQEALELLVGLPRSSQADMVVLVKNLLNLEDEAVDNLSFTRSLEISPKTSVKISVDIYEKEVYTRVLISKKNSPNRIIAFRTILQEDFEPIITIESLFDKPSDQLLQQCSNLLGSALSEYTKKILPKAQISQAITDRLEGTAAPSQQHRAAVYRTRDQRMRDYAPGNAQSDIGGNLQASKQMQAATAANTSSNHERSSARVLVDGLSVSLVAKLLDKAHIFQITPAVIIAKIENLVRIARDNHGIIPGKTLNKNAFGVVHWPAEFKMLQINIKIDGQAIRIYLQSLDAEAGTWHYRLIGIHHKIEGPKQKRYVENMLRDFAIN